MRLSKSFRFFAIAILTLSLLTPAALASGEGTAGDYFAGLGKQLGRGVWNVVSSPAEIPCTMRDDIKVKGGTGAATGFGKGLVFFGRRIIVGVSELLTFVMPSEATLPMVCSGDPLPQVA
jgi:putative exosortase-associated protein (TIGR04073 family)